MIKKLKIRFITLAMVSLVLLMAAIVASMNIFNYNSVVKSADETLDALSSNRGRLPIIFGDGLDDLIDDLYDFDDWESMEGGFYFYYQGIIPVPRVEADDDDDDDEDDAAEADSGNGKLAAKAGSDKAAGPHDKNGPRGSGIRGGNAPSWMTRDEAEETRFFTVLLDSSGNVIVTNTDRIYAVDDEAAAKYALQAYKKGAERGFIKDYRYAVSTEGSYTRVTFLDCGRMLESFRTFLLGSIVVSLIGLAIIFAIICYFAGKIVKPVAESYDKQKRFITDAGHEIKTPLTIIKANTDVMRMDIDDAVEEAEAGSEPCDDMEVLAGNLYESINDINGQVDRLTNLTNDLVYLSRMEEAEGMLTMTEVPVSDIVRETAEPFETVARERNKELEIDVVPMLSMQGSTKELEKLVSILVENALKYSPEGDRIKVSLRKEGRNIVLEVRNKASTPLSEDDFDHVFERFYRTDKSRNSAAGGHGIGLSMASAIVAAHGGKIRARGGDGSEFIVTATMPAA